VIVELSTVLTPEPRVVYDSDDANTKPGIAGRLLFDVMKPRIAVKLDRGGTELVTWAPGGDPGGNPLLAVAILAGAAFVLAFMVVGIARTVRG
jgi:hypothetical protein